MSSYDAVLLVSFGGPEGPDDVMPFLRRVTHGRGIPASRLAKVAEQYAAVGGVSPINDQCRRICRALTAELADHAIDLPVYWGNRNWTPFLADTLTEMAAAGHRHVVAIVLSAYSSHSGCRQYLDNIEAARQTVGPGAPIVDKARVFYDHPGFVEPFVDEIRRIDDDPTSSAHGRHRLVFSAHSLPVAMASRCDYEAQLRETARVVAHRSGYDDWDLVWQSRSGPPEVPWLEPDIDDHLRDLGAQGVSAVVVVPIGFVTDNMEVIWDLDVTAMATAAGVGIELRRAQTPGTAPDPRFVAMLRELVQERLDPDRPRRALGSLGPRPDPCAQECCPRAPSP